VKIRGSLENFAGTVQQIDRMIKYPENFQIPFRELGSHTQWYSGGQPVDNPDPFAPYLFDAIISLEKIQIAATILHPVVLPVMDGQREVYWTSTFLMLICRC
jgi:hypothetical protein